MHITLARAAAALAVAALGFAAHAAELSVATVPTLGGPSGAGAAINAAGDVAGAADVSSTVRRAFLYRNGVVTDLGHFGGSYSDATAINRRGDVVGYGFTRDGLNRAFLYRDGQLKDLQSLMPSDVEFSQARGINRRGDIVGSAARFGLPVRGFVYKGGAFTFIDAPDGGFYTLANAVNDSGQVAGTMLRADGSFGAFIYENGAVRDLGTPGESTEALAINARGDVAGTRAGRPALFRNGRVLDIGTLPGDPWGYAWALNRRSEVVGVSISSSSTRRAFVWRRGVMQDLNTLIDADRPYFIRDAQGINDDGVIVGTADTFNGDQSLAVVLTPVGERYRVRPAAQR